ncbi:MAG: Coenzyme F420 hydrogenase/dehydrogenase, beta subunit C-terminal domain [Gammaproteobacteria bacterium]|nr:Coenzyme F420 hydrogenase/dehydrogenase, beta subunit C-terminal domain [Gammaproteobacteria bacterium]
MRRSLSSIEGIREAQLCSGCGTCSYLAPQQFRMVDDPEFGRRPESLIASSHGDDAKPRSEALAACPGAALAHDFDGGDPQLHADLLEGFGPVRQLWEGHAADGALRFAGSSGGASSALALFALEHMGYAGVLHTAARPDAPYLNETVVSRTRSELLARTGSRYAPASPCEGLHHIEAADRPFVFIGKPCDVAGAGMASRLRPKLAANLGLTIAFFCAGTPSTAGTLAMLAAMGVDDPAQVRDLRYRGNGWPGQATVAFDDAAGQAQTRSMTYQATWGGILSPRVQWRCRLCVDHTGEFADVAVGDPWYRDIEEGESGSSLVLARTARGRAFVLAAIEAGYLVATDVPDALLVASQPNLLRTRGAVWGRLLGSRLVGSRVPRYSRLPTFRFWLSELSLGQKFTSVLGTARRCLQRGLAAFSAP